ncbi:MAG: hypothetical protein ACI9C4_001043 [Paraglaciecola sp.]|jgi:hypothetical protein
MKKVILTSLLALTTFTASASMESISKVRFAGDIEYSNFCKAVVNDDLDMLKRSVKSKVGLVATSSEGVMRKLISSDGVTCNGVDLIKFSEQRKASQVNAYLTTSV